MNRKVTVAKSAGFCFGVKNAVDGVYKLLGKNDNIVIFGELIHNSIVISDIEKKGARTVQSPDECLRNAVSVIRAHGVGKEVYENIKANSLDVVDLTCPYVKKIHSIAAEESEEGRKIIIIGDKNHPEVLGIKGWCKSEPTIIENEEEAGKISENNASIICQTTFNKSKYDNIITILKKSCKDIHIFDTICNATRLRQSEADEISSDCDVMFVIGSEKSSNTKKLYEICKSNCEDTYLIENFEGIPQNINYKNKNIGITAGASTPPGIIEEVAKAMDENKELSFEEMFEETLKTLNTGDVVKGTVVEISPTEVIVDLGFKSDGIIPASELSDDPDVVPEKFLKVGDVIDVFVVGVNDGEGKTLLSKKKLDAIAGQKRIEEALESGEILKGKVVSALNGGIIVFVEGSKVFVPARQISDRYIEDLSAMVNQDVELRVTEINRRRQVRGSILSVLKERKKAAEEKFWADTKEGNKYTGVVKSIMPFGVFVDIGGVDGLVHISELSWKRIKHPSDVVSIGDTMEVYIKEINEETKKISLGYRKDEDNPWFIAQQKFNVGDVVNVKIVRFMDFGAFAELINGVDGLIHISQIANKRIEKPSSELKIGQSVDAKITNIDWDAKRISLSIRALLEPETVEEAAEEAEEAVEAPAEEAAEVAEEPAAEAPAEAPAEAEEAKTEE